MTTNSPFAPTVASADEKKVSLTEQLTAISDRLEQIEEQQLEIIEKLNQINLYRDDDIRGEY